MCILSYLPANVRGDEMDLLNGAIANPHGHGWAITNGDHILMGKGMKAENVIDEFADMRKRYPAGHALFHSRWATHGNVDTDNCHPFYVGGTNGTARTSTGLTVVGHNGILPCIPHHDDKRSDTRLFADEILSTKYRRLDKKRAFEALTGYIGRANKLVILTVDPRYRQNAYVVNERAGHWDSGTGVWHSNYDYVGYAKYAGCSYAKGYTSPYATIGAPSRVTETVDSIESALEIARARREAEADEISLYDFGDTCAICRYGEIGKGGFCADCGVCEDCYEPSKTCQCWVRYARELVPSSQVRFSEEN